MKFFHGCTSAEEAKKTYRQLAKCFHPDKGGSTELMTKLQEQYESWDTPTIDPNPFTAGFKTYTPNNFGQGYQRYGAFTTNLNRDAGDYIYKAQKEAAEIKMQAALRETEYVKSENRRFQYLIDSLTAEKKAQDLMIKDLELQIRTLNRIYGETPSRKKIWEELVDKRQEIQQCYATILELKTALHAKESPKTILEKIKELIK